MDWVVVVVVAVFATLVVRALELFFVHQGCCESECQVSIQRRRRLLPAEPVPAEASHEIPPVTV